MKQVLLATGNQGKLLELQKLFGGLDLELKQQPNQPEYEVEETGTTFVENAIIKARHSARLSGLPTIADDSGLIIDALDGRPGVKTARYAGIDASSADNMSLVLSQLKECKGLQARSARFICVLVYLRSANDPLPMIAVGEWQGAICEVLSGTQGFGYDPIFWSFEENKTAAEMSLSTKQQYSHRSQAALMLKQQLINLGK